MAKTVGEAFNQFNSNSVNLDAERTKKARASRDWLFNQLEAIPGKNDNFPSLYSGMHIRYGSFARNTKIRPIDDIDLFLTFSGDGTTYLVNTSGQDYVLTVPRSAEKLRRLCNENYTLNSIKLVNSLKEALSNIEHYSSADIHRHQEAVTLKLSSYEWNFDIVPAFYTDTGYYIIPDGNGGWKASDPRIDQKRVNDIDQKFEVGVLQLIRTLKFWNRHAAMPTIPSYLFENIILNWLYQQHSLSPYIDFNLRAFWFYLKDVIYCQVPDPKGFQGNLNQLTQEQKQAIANKAADTYAKAQEAITLETHESDQQKSINRWREIFGNDFPKYE